MSDHPLHSAGWYPDPGGVHEYRWWDGTRWTQQVASHGQSSVAPLTGPGAVPTVNVAPERVQQQVAKVAGGGPVQAGGGTLFTEPVLVVNQLAKLLEVNSEYAIFSASGQQIGAVRQVGQSGLKKAIRVLTSYDQFMTHKFQVVDAAGTIVLGVTRPAKIMKSKVIIADATGAEVGMIRQENAIGKIRFAFEVGGQRIGGIFAENWRAWNFSIRDHTDTEVARITKTWEGLAKTMFTTADNYVCQIHRPLDEPLRSMVVASALSVDTALKQDSRGLG